MESESLSAVFVINVSIFFISAFCVCVHSTSQEWQRAALTKQHVSAAIKPGKKKKIPPRFFFLLI